MAGAIGSDMVCFLLWYDSYSVYRLFLRLSIVFRFQFEAFHSRCVTPAAGQDHQARGGKRSGYGRCGMGEGDPHESDWCVYDVLSDLSLYLWNMAVAGL